MRVIIAITIIINKMNQDCMKIKILLTGNSRVGKTSIFNRYSNTLYQDNFISTIGVDFCDRINVMTDDNKVNCQLWDTAGQERYKTIVKNYYKGASGLILVFDKTNRLSFEELDDWVMNVTQAVQNTVPILLMGNKVDMANHQVTTEEGKNYADQHKFYYIESSAKENINIENAFKLINEAAYHYYLKNYSFDDNITRLDNRNRNKNNCCKTK